MNLTATLNTLRTGRRDRGSAIPVCMVIVAGIGATSTTLLGRALVEQDRMRQEAAVERAAWRATGALELAKSVILSSPSVHGRNQAIASALASNPPLIAGTPVVVEAAGPPRWYRLSSRGTFAGSESLSQCLVRDGTAYVAWECYVENDSLGLSGQAKGRIHTNKTLELRFAGGIYTDTVSAANGFSYLSGANAGNTSFLGGSNPASRPMSLLANLDFDELESQASYVAPSGSVADITLDRKIATIRLYTPALTVSVPSTTTRQVLTGYETRRVSTPVYVTVWRWVPETTTTKAWVVGPPPISGAAAGGAATTTDPTGSWQTVTTTTQVLKQVEVVDHYDMVERQVADYATVTVDSAVTQTVAGTLQSTVTVPASGVIYVPGAIQGISGDLNGNLTVATGSTATITGHLRYVDDAGQTACLNGTDPSAGSYVPNPAFHRNHALAVIARGDIVYSVKVPTHLEIQATLISTTGRVGMQGVGSDEDGTLAVRGVRRTVLDSLTRFGTIMSSLRPVSTLVDDAGSVIHGFESGAAVHDPSLILSPPPACPTDASVTFLESTRLDPGSSFGVSTPTFGRGVCAMPMLKNVSQIQSAIGANTVDWGVDR